MRFGTIGLLLSVLLPSTVMAEESEELVYRYRSDVMEASSNHLKALKRYVEGKLPIKAHVPSHVDALLNLNAMYKDLFPAGKQYPESEAKGLIWGDPKGFQQAIEHNRRKMMALKQVDPSDIAMLQRAVNEVRMSCGDCHYYFKDGR